MRNIEKHRQKYKETERGKQIVTTKHIESLLNRLAERDSKIKKQRDPQIHRYE